MRLEIHSETKSLEMDGMGVADFVRIYIDGIEIATHAASFGASSPEITLDECEYCYSCGVPTIAAREIDDHSVIWFTNPDHGRGHGVATEELRIFNMQEYEAALNGKTTDLPELSCGDLRHIFSLEQVPDWKGFLYCLPEIDGDETGANTLGLIVESISSLSITPISQPISKFKTVTFGFGIDRLWESEIDFAILANDLAFRFRSFPSIPVWFKIEQVSDGFAAIRHHVDNAG